LLHSRLVKLARRRIGDVPPPKTCCASTAVWRLEVGEGICGRAGTYLRVGQPVRDVQGTAVLAGRVARVRMEEVSAQSRQSAASTPGPGSRALWGHCGTPSAAAPEG
jgi:hypothetical protein